MMTQGEIEKEEIRRYGTTEHIELGSIYEDCLGLFVYDDDVIVGHRKRLVQITDKTKNSIEFRECEGRPYRSWMEMKVWDWKIKSAESEIDFNRKFINSETKKEIIKKINSNAVQNKGVRFIKINAGMVER